MRRPCLLLASVLVLTSTASFADPAPGRGEIETPNGSAAFDAKGIFGPEVSISKIGDHQWRGWLRGRTVDVTVENDHIVGANTSVYVKHEGAHLAVRGIFLGRLVDIELPAQGLRNGSPWESASYWLRASGTAADANPPMPQTLFALMAAQ